MKILETKRLILRHLLPEDLDDLDDLFALYRDPEIRRYFPEGTLTYAETKAELEWFLNGHPDRPELGLWATILKESDRFIGRCGLLPWTLEQRPEVEVAYLLAKEYWGRGLATEAARGIVQYAVERLGPVSAGLPGDAGESGVGQCGREHRHDPGEGDGR